MLVHCSSCRRAKVNTGTDRRQIQSQGEQSAHTHIVFSSASRPILTLNFKDSINNASALCGTALVITAKQKKSDLMSALSRDQSVSKSQQTLLSSRCTLHCFGGEVRMLHPALSSFLSGFLCSCPHVALTDLLNEVCSPTSLFHLLRNDGFPLHWGLISYGPQRGENGKMSQRIATCVSRKSSGLMHRTTDLCLLFTTENSHTPHIEQCIAAFPVCQAAQVSSSFLLVGQGHLAAEPQKSRVKLPQQKLQLPCN